ncbi:MAG: hypothetical protein LBV12_06775 [Puniceicoccales bacterium]|jgi:hypothetical protein|nr:hypothetical protein [Puniceicoccales bacterium]
MSDKLQNADKALVELAKLTDYLLSSTHPDGKAKAKFFMQFGFLATMPQLLETSLRKHGLTQPVVEVKTTEHGVKYILECSLSSPDGRNPCIRSVWIIDSGETVPRLVTAYPN